MSQLAAFTEFMAEDSSLAFAAKSYCVNFGTDCGRTEIYMDASSIAGAVFSVMERYPECEGDFFQITVRRVPA